jgi:predicted DsbA family dithiol-disulfide isomerase
MPIMIDYFSDILCIWAYISQARMDELHQEFNEQVKLHIHYFPVFGHTHKKFEDQWKNKGGIHGYAEHVQTIAKSFEHISLHPDLWIKNQPRSSLPAHLHLSAIKLLETAGDIEKNSVEKASHHLRHAFFQHNIDISNNNTLYELAAEQHLPTEHIRSLIQTGEAFAALSQDMKLALDMNVKSSPTLIFNEDRQRLAGNVGYKIIQANIRELLASPVKQHSWC